MQQVYKIFAPKTIWVENVPVQLVQPIAQFPDMVEAIEHFNKEVLPFDGIMPNFQIGQTTEDYTNSPAYQEYLSHRTQWEQEYPARIWNDSNKQYVSPATLSGSYIQEVWINQSV